MLSLEYCGVRHYMNLERLMAWLMERDVAESNSFTMPHCYTRATAAKNSNGIRFKENHKKRRE